VVTAHEYGWWEWRPRGLAWAWHRLGTWGEAHNLWDREDLALLTGAGAVIMTNEAAVQVVAARLPQLMRRVTRVPIGSNIVRRAADPAVARAAVRSQSGWPADALVVAYFGFLHPVKGLETLLAAFRQVRAARPCARLLLIGGAESLALHGDDAQRYEERLRDEVRSLELEEAVRLTGYLAEEVVSHCLAGSDIGVLPFNAGVTLKSGSLLALWEHGLPVVATRPPTVEPELAEGACLVPCRDANALAAGLGRLLDDPPLRQALAERGRRAAARFSWAAIAEQHLSIYERLLSARRPELRMGGSVGA
jgi:glycosyltransferase involved in cell wall biosynthesis